MITELYIPPAVEAARALDKLDDALLTLRLDLGKLEAAWQRAFAPVTARVVPLLDGAVRAVTDFAEGAGHVIAALFGGVRLEAERTVKVTGSALRRSLADFDRLDRLSGGGSGSYSYTVPAQLKDIPEEFRRIARQIQRILEPLKRIDLQSACDAFHRLRQAIEPLTRELFSGLEWLWFQVLTPMAAWSLEQALPVFLDGLTAGLRLLNTVIEGAKPLLSWLWEKLLQPMGQWAGQTLLSALSTLCRWLEQLGRWAQGLSPVAAALGGLLSDLEGGFRQVCAALGLWDSTAATVGPGMAVLERMGRGLASVFGLLEKTVGELFRRLGGAVQVLAPALRQSANVVAAIVNTMLLAVETAVNAMVSALNSIRIDIPGWVPLVGGRRFSMELDYVRLPRVPALAQGAVLPANRPFLAVVGDQRQGTNVEAPLSVIQEAVGQVLGRGSDAQQDTNRLLRQLLEAVAAIQVGDETIGRAARRYENRMAVMGGIL